MSQTTKWVPHGVPQWYRLRQRLQDELDSQCPNWTKAAFNHEVSKKGRQAFALQWDRSGR